MTIYNEELKVKKSKLGLLNRYLLLCTEHNLLKPLNIFNKFLFHLELPKNSYTKKIRMGHPFNIIVNSKAILGNNITMYHNITIGSKQWGGEKWCSNYYG